MPIRRKRKITSDLRNLPETVSQRIERLSEEIRNCNTFIKAKPIKDRGPSPIIPTLAGHCYACDYHEDEGHSPTCPVLIAEQLIANAGPSPCNHTDKQFVAPLNATENVYRCRQCGQSVTEH